MPRKTSQSLGDGSHPLPPDPASETRAKAVSIAGQFGYGLDDAEDIAQDVMLKLWNLHEQLKDAAHLKARQGS